jgi:hypothetical protein
MEPDFHRLVNEVVYGERPLAARTLLFAMDEAAVEPLIAEFYAGVDDATGVAILDILGEIGGPDALATLWNVYHFEEKQVFIESAVRGLMRNRLNLDQAETKELLGHLRHN